MDVGWKHWIVAAAFVLALPVVGSANPVVKTGVKKLMQYFQKNAARELAEAGAESTSRSAAKLIAKYGDDILPVLQRIGPKGVTLAERHGDEALSFLASHGRAGVAALSQHGPLALRLTKSYGDDAVALMVKHPGVAEQLATLAGREALPAVTKLSSQQAIHLAKLVPEIRKLPPEAQKTFWAQLAKGGDDFVQWAYRNRKKIFTLGVGASVVGGSAGVAHAAAIGAYKVGDGLAGAVPQSPPATAAFDPETQPFWALIDRQWISILLFAFALLLLAVVVFRQSRGSKSKRIPRRQTVADENDR